MSPRQPLNFNQLSEQIYETLKKDIVGGDLKPGQRLSLSELGEELKVSVTPIRDALHRLAKDGLVEIVPRRGTVVTSFSRRRIRETYQIRRILECAAAEELNGASPDLGGKLEKLAAQMELLWEGETLRDYYTYMQLDTEFHSSIIGLLHNESASRLYQELRWPAQVMRGLSSYAGYQKASQRIGAHRAIAQAFREGNIQQAKSLIEEHLKNAEADMVRVMPEE